MRMQKKVDQIEVGMRHEAWKEGGRVIGGKPPYQMIAVSENRGRTRKIVASRDQDRLFIGSKQA